MGQGFGGEAADDALDGLAHVDSPGGGRGFGDGAEPAAGLLQAAGDRRGRQVEVLYRPSMNWTFRAGWTHVKTEYEDFNISKLGDPGLYDKILSGNPEGDFEGKSFPNTPEDVAILSIRYDGEFAGSDWRYYTEVQGNYASKRYLDQGNLSYLPDSTVGEFNAGLTSDNWMIVAYVENFTDEDTIRSGLGNVNFGFMPGGQVPPFSANLVLPQPRTFGMRARYKF